MYNLENKTLAISPLFINNTLKGMAFSSKDKSIFIECDNDLEKKFKITRNTFIQNTINQAKRVIGYEYQSIVNHFELPNYRSIKSIFYNLNPSIRLKSIKDIMKVSDDYSRPDKFITIGDSYKNSLEFQKLVSNCIKEAQFIYGYYFENRNAYNSESVKLDNKLIKLLSYSPIIDLDTVEVKTLSVLYLTKQWDFEHEMWGITGYPFNYINEVDKKLIDSKLNNLYEEVNSLKAKYSNISDYKNCDRIEIKLDPVGSSTGRIICRDDFGVFTPASYHRNIFKSKKGYSFVEFDYKHQEATIIANITKDPVLVDVVNDDSLYEHIAKLSKLNTNEFRELGKNLFFSIVYGSKPDSLVKRFNIKPDNVNRIYNYINRKFPITSDYITKKFKVNLFGRKLHSNNFNSLIQSTAADIIKYKLLELKSIQLPVLILSDALVFEISDEEIVTKVNKIKNILNNPINSIGEISPLLVKVSKNKTLKF